MIGSAQRSSVKWKRASEVREEGSVDVICEHELHQRSNNLLQLVAEEEQTNEQGWRLFKVVKEVQQVSAIEKEMKVLRSLVEAEVQRGDVLSARVDLLEAHQKRK